MHHDALKRLIARGLGWGAVSTLSATRFRWDLRGDCLEPVRVVHYARPPAKASERYVVIGPGKPKPLELEMFIPCKHCETCMYRRKMELGRRAWREAQRAQAKGCRTWLCTLTCSPDYLYQVTCKVDETLALQGKSLEHLDDRQYFLEKDAVVYRDVQKLLKRLRKGRKGSLPAVFNYLCVTERTPEFRSDGTANALVGEPHYHLLVHETDALRPVRQRVLKDGLWVGGYADFRLVRDTELNSIAYVGKYLAKSYGRFRASVGYGSAWHGSSDATKSIEDGTQSNVARAVLDPDTLARGPGGSSCPTPVLSEEDLKKPGVSFE